MAMLKYLPGLIGALAAMVAFRWTGMLDFSVRILIFVVVYVVVTVSVDLAMARYGKRKT